jgi:hypothetical protein
MAKAVIIDKIGRTKVLKAKRFGISKILYKPTKTVIKTDIPFRVKFVTIGIEGYGPNNPAPIGIAVIGYSNYIL